LNENKPCSSDDVGEMIHKYEQQVLKTKRVSDIYLLAHSRLAEAENKHSLSMALLDKFKKCSKPDKVARWITEAEKDRSHVRSY
jgi:hypothetical protein